MSVQTHEKGAGLGLWLALIAFESAAQVALKLGGDGLAAVPFGLGWILAGLGNVAVLAAIGCYIGSFLSWMLILRRSHLSLAFPLSSIVLVVVLLVSWLGLGEQIGGWHWVGVGLIMAGVGTLAERE